MYTNMIYPKYGTYAPALAYSISNLYTFYICKIRDLFVVDVVQINTPDIEINSYRSYSPIYL